MRIGKTIKKQIYTAILSPLLSQMTVITFPSWFTETKNETCNSYDHQDDHCYIVWSHRQMLLLYFQNLEQNQSQGRF